MGKLKDRFRLTPGKLAAAAMIGGTALVYWWSPDSQAQVLQVNGNHIFSDARIYQMAGVKPGTHMYLIPQWWWTSRLEKSPFIKDVKVKRSGNKLTFDVEEVFVLGYVVEDGRNWLLDLDGSLLPLDESEVGTIMNFPLLSGFDHAQLESIAASLRGARKYLNENLIAQIAEITPYQFSYDENGVCVLMNDGNYIFSRISDLSMIVGYEPVIEKLQGPNACFQLNAQESTIQTDDCTYLKMPLDERIQYQEMLSAQAAEAAQAAETPDNPGVQ